MATVQFEDLIATVPPEHLAALMAAFGEHGSRLQRVAAIANVLRAAGDTWREQIGRWIADLLSVESLVPEVYAPWRPLVHHCMAFVASHISDARLAPKIVEQLELPPETPPEKRLGLLIAKTPGLQKLGQVLARTRRLSPSLRTELQKLENGISDVTPAEIQTIVRRQLGTYCMNAYRVKLASVLLSEASVSAILEFTWFNPATGKEEEGVFKVMKPHVPACYAEDLTLLQELAADLAAHGREYYFASREVADTLEEVRLLLEREVDFRREQATLAEVRRVYRRGRTRVPKPIPELSTDTITAMSVERGVKVTDALRSARFRRDRIAAELVGSLLADPIFSTEEDAVFHADPHAGNLLYDEARGELIVLDWALTGRLTLDERRQIARLIMMMTFRDAAGVRAAIFALSRSAPHAHRKDAEIIERSVKQFFAALPLACSLGAIDAMRLLDSIGVDGVRFPAALVLIRKVIFTLDGVLCDIAGDRVRIDTIVTREFLMRWIAQFGSLPSPFRLADLLAVQRSAFRYVTGLWAWSA